MGPKVSNPTSARRVTRSRNATSHPGLIDRGSSRRTATEVAAEKEAKKAHQEATVKAKKKREHTLSEIELQMKENENKQHWRYDDLISKAKVQELEDVVPEPQPTSQLQARSVKLKRKRTPVPEVPTTEEESSEGEPLTPSPNDNRSSPLSECESDNNQGDACTEKTPKPPKKKIKSGKPDVHSRDDGEEIAVDDAMDTEDEIYYGDEQSQAGGQSASTPRSSTATSQKSSRVANWASAFFSSGLKTPVPHKGPTTANGQQLVRAAAVSVTPCMLPPTAKAGSVKPKPRPKGKGKGTVRKGDQEATDRTTTNVKQEPVSDGEMIEERGYIETDDETSEALAAKGSPIKHGARLTSAALVKCEPVDLATPGKIKKAGASKRSAEPPRVSSKRDKDSRAASKKARSRGVSKEKPIEIDDSDDDGAEKSATTATVKSRAAPKNSDLPSAAHTHNAWRTKFIPTFLKALGTREDPWGISDRQTIGILQPIWDAIYGEDVPWTIEVNDAVHSLATQRMYEWRCAFGHAAMGTYEAFFDACPTEFPDVEARKEFCLRIIRGGRLFFEDPEGSENTGLYRSPFVIAGLAGHMDVIQGAVAVPDLFPSAVDEYPYGAIGMAAAGAYRVALLWCLRKLAYDSKGNVYAIKSLNNNTGKWSNKDSSFSITNFGGKAIQCSKSARKLSTQSLGKIMEAALTVAGMEPARPAAEMPVELQLGTDFDFAMLVEVPFYLAHFGYKANMSATYPRTSLAVYSAQTR
ncbi:hypothetical protein C8Q79DRAFT_1006481 [Trametes meyenii]|nr:hypothetical protein C8Q79DRAFT_1006481 [Trametes meyenii]